MFQTTATQARRWESVASRLVSFFLFFFFSFFFSSKAKRAVCAQCVKASACVRATSRGVRAGVFVLWYFFSCVCRYFFFVGRRLFWAPTTDCFTSHHYRFRLGRLSSNRLRGFVGLFQLRRMKTGSSFILIPVKVGGYIGSVQVCGLQPLCPG